MSGKGKDHINGGGLLSPDTDINSILLLLANPRDYELDFDQEIQQSTSRDNDPQKQMNNIVQAFNRGHKTIMTSSAFGKTVSPGKFRIVSLNNMPEVVPPTSVPKRKQKFYSPRNSTKEHGSFDQTQLFMGACGSYIVNVPNGRIAKVWKNNEPILLGPGPHVIHDQNFRPITEADLVDYGTELIRHGTYAILRIAPTTCGKISINNMPYFLVARDKPYVFKDPTVQLPEHAHIKLTSPVISHQNYTIIQVPEGKVAKVWLDPSTPRLLESRREPYVYSNPGFQVQRHTDKEWFADTTERLITHGAIKRILPRTGEVVVTYDNGKLVTFTPSQANEPIIITSPNHSVESFLPTNIQTMRFPSEATKKERLAENRVSDNDVDYSDVNYEVFRTSDGLPIGVKLLVVYEIENPNLTLTKLKPENILSHIEHLVCADMGRVLQQCSSVDFLKSNQSAKRGEAVEEPDFYAQLQERVFATLRADFATYGITLQRLNIETPKILDKGIAEQMAKFSLVNTETQAKEAVIGKQTALAKQEAAKNAAVLKIEQDQQNENKISAAKASLASAQMEQDAILIKVQAKAKEQQMLLEVDEKRASMFDKHPGLLQFELAKIQQESMKGIQSTIISPEVAANYYGIGLVPTKVKAAK